MKTVVVQACRVVVMLLLIAAVPAVVSAWLGRDARVVRLDGNASMEVMRQWPEVLWIDARGPEAFAFAHWRGAVNLSPASWDSQIGAVLEAWRPEVRIVVYCDDSECGSSEEVAGRLRREYDLPEVHVLSGGWEALSKEINP